MATWSILPFPPRGGLPQPPPLPPDILRKRMAPVQRPSAAVDRTGRDNRSVSSSKVATMRDAVAELVRDGDTVAIEGFTHLISFAAGHEIIRQRKRDLTLARLTPDLIYDQMIAGGVARKLIFSWLGNPGVGGLNAIRRRIEDADPAPLEIEEYSHFGMVGRYTAGAANLPFFPLRSYFETDLPKANPLIREIESPYGDGKVYAVPPLRPDVTVDPRPARRRRRQHPGLGPARLPEGGRLRGRAGDRRGRGAGRRGRDPGRPEPDDRPRADRRRGRRRAVGGAPVVRPGRLRPRQPVLPRLGPDQPRRGRRPGLARRVGPRRSTGARPTWRSWARSGSPRSGRAAPRRPARSTTGSTGDAWTPDRTGATDGAPLGGPGEDAMTGTTHPRVPRPSRSPR